MMHIVACGENAEPVILREMVGAEGVEPPSPSV